MALVAVQARGSQQLAQTEAVGFQHLKKADWVWTPKARQCTEKGGMHKIYIFLQCTFK
jgi:hypothetical protein